MIAQTYLLQKKETKSSNRSWLKPYKPYDAKDSLLKQRKENILRNSSAEDDVQGLAQLNKVRKVLGLSNKENDLSKS